MDIIGLLFKSGIRKRIITRFFADESRKFYINEMARHVHTSQGTCRRELNKLVDMGLLTASRTGNLRYYEVNKTSPFHKEFRAIIQKTIGIEGMLREKLQGLRGIAYAFFFGSYVKQEFKSGSDLDIVVIGAISEDRLLEIFREVEQATGREINYHIYSMKEFIKSLQVNSFTKNIIKNYILVAGDDGKFKTLLNKT